MLLIKTIPVLLDLRVNVNDKYNKQMYHCEMAAQLINLCDGCLVSGVMHAHIDQQLLKVSQ